ncbi:MAG: DUF3348 domain-containing protein [Pseudomonas sp.]
MVQLPRHTTIRGPAFIRLLAGLTDADLHPPKPLPSERLSEWLDLNHAIALSAALDGNPGMTASDDASPTDAIGQADCARVRDALADAIVADRAFTDIGAHQARDYAFFRQRYLALQQAMETGIGQLRARLRDRLALASTDLARLAAVDAVMERALSRRERILLSRATTLLGRHFERLQRTGQETADGPREPPPDPPTTTPGAWLEIFRKDMQAALLAELDVRLHPIEGLLAALRTQPRA